MTNARTAKTAREKAAQMRADAERQAARKRALVAGILVLVVIALAAGSVIAVRSLQSKATAAPANLVDGGIVAGNASSSTTLEIYEDFQCPACKLFENSNSALIDDYVKGGKVKIIYRPVAILDWASTTQYSTRALNMVAAVVNTTPAAFPALHKALFENQPPENSAGLTDAQLLDIAVKAGAQKDVVEKAMKDMTYKGWTKTVSNDLSKRFPPGATPTVVLNGAKLDNPGPDQLKAAVDKALAG